MPTAFWSEVRNIDYDFYKNGISYRPDQSKVSPMDLFNVNLEIVGLRSMAMLVLHDLNSFGQRQLKCIE